MNREIKFRAWCGSEMAFSDDYGSLGINNKDEGAFFEDCKNCPIMQYTGLKDKNGVEIYEGDICSGHSDGNGKITYQEDCWVYEFDDLNVVGLWEAKPLEVIGNIYQNPELLN